MKVNKSLYIPMVSRNSLFDYIATPPTVVPQPFTFNEVYLFGASIMDDAANPTSSQSGVANLAEKIAYCGVTATVYDSYAISGSDSSQYATMAENIESEIGSQSVVVLHGCGNDVSREGPYPGGAANMDLNIRSAVSDITDTGAVLMMSTITYRVPPASNPSDPYNQNIIKPIISEYSPEFWKNNEPVFNMYDVAFENQDKIPDGIHPNGVLAEIYRNYIARTLCQRSFAEDNATAADFYGKTVIITCGIDSGIGEFTPSFSGGTEPGTNKSSGVFTIPVLKTTEQNLLWGTYVEVTNVGGGGSAGFGNAGDNTISLSNDVILTNYIYNNVQCQAIGTSKFKIGGLPNGLTGTMSIVTSRSSQFNRTGDYTVQGVTQRIDAFDDTGVVFDFPFTIVDGTLLLEFKIPDGNIGYAYINGMQLTFDGEP